jgi:CRISPR-associated protein Csy1
MVDPAIAEFFDERKAAWLKKNIKASMSDLEVREKEIECEDIFSLKNWLPNAASRAGQISISTHPCTFSHPSARKNKNGYVSSIIANSEKSNDGFLRSGNVNVAADALGNAAALDVYKFLTLEMSDGQPLIQHLEQDSELAQTLLTLSISDDSSVYEKLKQGFLAMTTESDERVTSSKIKQVYFPMTEHRLGMANQTTKQETSYHQLSTLTASGLVFEMRKRLDGIRFSENLKIARDKKRNHQVHEDFREIYNLTTMAYGGTKPQNISVLNNQNAGKVHLLMSMPPILKKRDIHFPQSDFFSQSVRYSECKAQFLALHQLYRQDEKNNMQVRNLRDEYYQSIVDHIIEKMWQVRSVAKDQYYPERNQLSAAQKIWLCEHNEETRESNDDWLDEICDAIIRFLFHGYEKTLHRSAIKFSDVEHWHQRKIVFKNKEALR